MNRELVRGPGDWEGPPPAGQLVMGVVRRQPADRPGWETVSGWRWLDTEPGPAWVTVQVREMPPAGP